MPGLRGPDLTKVTQANLVDKAALRLLSVVMTTKAVVSIESPERSWLWPLLSSWVKRMNPALATWYRDLEDVIFDVGCHGGNRDKATGGGVPDRAGVEDDRGGAGTCYFGYPRPSVSSSTRPSCGVLWRAVRPNVSF